MRLTDAFILRKLTLHSRPFSVSVFPKIRMTLAFIYTWQMLLSKVPCIAFKVYNYQFVHCLGIEPKTLALLAPHSTTFLVDAFIQSDLACIAF